MNIRKFSQEISDIIPTIFIYFVKSQKNKLTSGELTFPQIVILDYLFKKGICKMSDLSMVLGVTGAGATGLVDRLIKLGMVNRFRSDDDRRVVKVILTQKGIKSLKKIQSQRLRTIAELFSDLNYEERKQYLHILKKLQKNIQKRLNR